MIQSISNSSTNLEPSQTLSSQINKRTAKLPRTSGLSGLSASTRELIIKETLNLIKGVAIDLLKAALTSLNQQANQVGGSKIKDDGGKPQVESTTSSDNVDSNDSTESVDSENNSSQISQVETTPPRKNESLSSFLQRELKPNSEGNFHEEQLQYGIAGYLLNEKSPALYSQYKTAFSEYKALAGSKGNFEDGVKIALKDLVTSKHLSLKNAETINGESFRAAQLDKDFKTLFDDKGGPNDKTIAVLGYKDAAEKVGRTYGRIHRGELDAPARSLNAPSNSKSNTKTAKSSLSAGAGFLWKPVSSSDGKLAILTPSNISKNVESVSIYQTDINGNKSLIENGSTTGMINEGRLKFSFRKAGGEYPNGLIVEMKLKNGEVISETIAETSSRVGN